MYDFSQLAKRVKELRKIKGYTQEKTAEEIGLNIKTYKMIERGKRVGNIDTLCLIAEYYAVSLDYLLLSEKKFNDEYLQEMKYLSPEIRQIGLELIKAVITVLQKNT